jgi:hypothetical protein
MGNKTSKSKVCTDVPLTPPDYKISDADLAMLNAIVAAFMSENFPQLAARASQVLTQYEFKTPAGTVQTTFCFSWLNSYTHFAYNNRAIIPNIAFYYYTNQDKISDDGKINAWDYCTWLQQNWFVTAKTIPFEWGVDYYD